MAGRVQEIDLIVKLTTSPSGIRRHGLDALRAHGFSAEQLVDAAYRIG
jgi:hypothetical protein